MEMVIVEELPRGIIINAGEYLLIGTKESDTIKLEKEPA